MRTVLFAAVAAALFLNPSTVAADPVKSGMEALKKNRYEESVNAFVSALPSVKADGGRFYLSFGVALFENARLYSELYGLSLTLHTDHLTRLAAASGRDRSRFARLYLGKALLEAGRPKQAASHLERFISEKKAPQKYKNIARVRLGLSYFNQGMKKKALGIWGAIKSSDPDVISELAYIYSSLGIKGKDPVLVADSALGLAKKSKKRPSAALVTNLIGVYAEA